MQRKVTINDIADLAKTSKTTVSFYLNGRFDKMSQETKSRIKEAIEATNYKPSIAARSLNAKATKLIGVVIGDITNSFSNQIVKGIESKAQEFGYQIIIGNSNYDPSREDELIEKMLNLGVDGFIIQPTSNFRKYSRIIEVKKSAWFSLTVSSMSIVQTGSRPTIMTLFMTPFSNASPKAIKALSWLLAILIC